MAKPDVHEQWQQTGRLEIGPERRKLLATFLASLVLIVVGVWLILDGAVVPGLIIGIFFGLLAIPAGVQLTRLPRVTITTEGIEVSGLPVVPWQQVTGTEELQVYRNPTVILTLTAEQRDLLHRDLSNSEREFHSAVEVLTGAPSFALPTTLAISNEELHDMVERARVQGHPD